MDLNNNETNGTAILFNQQPIDILSKLFNDKMTSDVTFVFPNEMQPKCACPNCDFHTKPVTIPSHQLILASGCQKFRDTFYGGTGTIKTIVCMITITKWSSKTFSEFLQLFYCTNPVFTDIAGILQLIKDYDVNHFIDVVEEFMAQSVAVDNCIFYLHLTLEHGLRVRLLGKIRHFIRLHAISVFETEAFRECPRQTLNTILEMRDLKCSEVDVFVAAMQWATTLCFQNCLDATDKNRRDVLGTSFHLVRFPTMTMAEFSHCLTQHPQLLDTKEILDIMAYLILKKPLSKCSSFSNLPRMID